MPITPSLESQLLIVVISANSRAKWCFPTFSSGAIFQGMLFGLSSTKS